MEDINQMLLNQHYSGQLSTKNKSDAGDTVSNLTTSRRAPGYLHGNKQQSHSANKTSTSKLYQRYRKLYETEKKDKEQLKESVTVAKGEIGKLKVSNTDLMNQIKRLRQHNPEKEAHEKFIKA